jgi:hypothetical protein
MENLTENPFPANHQKQSTNNKSTKTVISLAFPSTTLQLKHSQQSELKMSSILLILFNET